MEDPEEAGCVGGFAGRESERQRFLGFVGVGSEDSVPEGEDEAEICVALALADGVVRAVHIGRDEDGAEVFFARFFDGGVGVVEDRHAGEQDFKDHDAVGGGAQRVDGCDFDSHAEEDFYWVESQRAGCVYIGVCVVGGVDSPQRGDFVEEGVLGVDEEV